MAGKTICIFDHFRREYQLPQNFGVIQTLPRPIIFFMMVSFFVVIPWGVAILLGIIGNESHYSDILKLSVIPPIAISFFLFIPVLQHGNLPGLKGEHTYKFMGSGIRLSGPGFDNHIQWSQNL
ncbi:hypothetical protein BTA51_28290 [Hahella sp. CCB-MM4]|uniref:hypothetical protein n=1 Tax=Hahella sp. (strain CCB-MM4) TaxID=1926491 RepID=UPI000B9AAB9F|nr:hypothetical protein [Hahella sp. CCB-MM4]OZG70030.1 hypothetical protein BTA51_28290 [Hahella sp. CCB-MM4]